MEALLQKATRQHTKHHNSQLVLRTIYDYGEISRAELARLTQLTRATISEVVAELLRKGLVEEVGHAPPSVGRTPVLLSVVADSRHLIAIDIANGELRGAVVNLRGEIRQRVAVPLQEQHGDAVVALIYEVIDRLIRQTEQPLLGIGIGTPGLVDTIDGGVRRAVNLGWNDLPLRTVVHARYELPVYVANDSHLAALAEYTFGDERDSQHLVVLQVGRGIGAGIVLKGQLFSGVAGSAGEIGHVVVVDHGQLCRCGNTGCLETVASSRAIIRRSQAIARDNAGSSLHRYAAAPEQLTLDAVQRACQAGDSAVQQMIRETGYYLGIAVAQIVGILNIRRILIAGRVAAFGQPLLDGIRHAVNTRLLTTIARETEILIAGLGADAVILGASALLLTSELGLARLGTSYRPAGAGALAAQGYVM